MNDNYYTYNGNNTYTTTTSGTTGIVWLQDPHPTQLRSRTALEAIEDRVEDICTVGRQRLAAAA